LLDQNLPYTVTRNALFSFSHDSLIVRTDMALDCTLHPIYVRDQQDFGAACAPDYGHAAISVFGSGIFFIFIAVARNCSNFTHGFFRRFPSPSI
jgi:hypothetical protein